MTDGGYCLRNNVLSALADYMAEQSGKNIRYGGGRLQIYSTIASFRLGWLFALLTHALNQENA